jgi:D-sedoheptulose 7-phosphate isomerase
MKIDSYLENLILGWSKVDISKLSEAVRLVQETLDSNSSVFVIGNGGSSSTASHFVADWVKGNRETNGIAGKVFCLSDNTPLITAIGNDMDYDQIFAYQLRSYAKTSDLLVCVTGSGNSRNIINACIQAKSLGMKVVTLTGFDGGETLRIADFSFHCPVEDMQIVEDMHMSFGHMVIRCQVRD